MLQLSGDGRQMRQDGGDRQLVGDVEMLAGWFGRFAWEEREEQPTVDKNGGSGGDDVLLERVDSKECCNVELTTQQRGCWEVRGVIQIRSNCCGMFCDRAGGFEACVHGSGKYRSLWKKSNAGYGRLGDLGQEGSGAEGRRS